VQAIRCALTFGAAGTLALWRNAVNFRNSNGQPGPTLIAALVASMLPLASMADDPTVLDPVKDRKSVV
jgi:hypothetical protein